MQKIGKLETFNTNTEAANQNITTSQNEVIYSPSQRLIQFNKAFPKTGKLVNLELAKCSKEDYPNYVFMPAEAWIKIIQKYSDKSFDPIDGIDIRIFSTLAIWQYTKGVYELPERSLSKHFHSPSNEMITVDRFKTLPEWSIYVKNSTNAYELDGFFVSLDYVNKSKLTYIRIVLNSKYGLQAITIQLGNWKIEDALHCLLKKQLLSNPLKYEQIYRDFLAIAKFCISIIVELCSDDSILKSPQNESSYPIRPIPKKVKQGLKLFPAEQTKYWSVENLKSKKVIQVKDYQGGIHKSPKPHPRRGHRRNQWVGVKGTPERKQIKIWIDPKFINGVAA